MIPRPVQLAWIAAATLLAAAVAYLISRESSHSHAGPGGPESEAEFHRWMHENLAITPEQARALDPYETQFETERLGLRAEIREAGHELAAAIRRGGRASAEVEAALGRLNRAQSELQRATLDHFFAMKEHLDPDQAERLVEWTHDSILHQHRE